MGFSENWKYTACLENPHADGEIILNLKEIRWQGKD
jgi:hypothetical protein